MTRTNIFRTPSLESTLPGGLGVLQTTSTTTGVIAGSKSLKIEANGSNDSFASTEDGGGVLLYPGFTSGTTYTMSGYITLTGPLGTTQHARARRIVLFHRSTGGVYTEFATSQAPNTAGTHRVSTTFTMPANTSQIFIRFYNGASNGGGSVYYDAILIEEGTVLGDYFDGSTVKAGYTYAWTGTADSSTSTETATAAPTTLAPAVGVAATVTTALSAQQSLASAVSGEVSVSTALTPLHSLQVSVGAESSATTTLAVGGTASAPVDAGVTVTTTLSAHRNLDVPVSSEVTVGTLLDSGEPVPEHPHITVPVLAEVVAHTELGYVVQPAELGSTFLDRLASFSVSTSATPINPAEGSGSTPSVNAGYIKGVDPEFALGETNEVSNGAIGQYTGEIVRLSLPEGSDVAAISQDTPLTLLNNDLNLFPFIDAAPSTWTAARAIDYWTQQCGLFYDKVPGDCIAYASGFGHGYSYSTGTSARFHEKLTGGPTSTTVLNGRSVKTFGSAVAAHTAFHELPNTNLPISVPKNQKLVASIGLGLRGNGRTAAVGWNMVDAQGAPRGMRLEATSAGAITAALDGVPVASTSVPAGGDYRLTFSVEPLSSTAVVVKLSVHTDNLDGTGASLYESPGVGVAYAMPTVMRLASVTHLSSGGSGAEMLRWGTYLTVAVGHPGIPAVQKTLSQTAKEFGFVSGFTGNVWALLNEYCAITRQDIGFLDAKLTVTPRISGLSAPRGNFSRFSRDSERREKYKQVAVVNKQSKAVTNGTAVFWRADSVYQLNTREVQEFTVQTDHSILSVANPTPVPGITPFPYKTGTGQYVVTGADGYIIAPQWWTDNGGKVEVSLTGKEGEIAIKITAPRVDSVRAPYRISEGAADRPALYVSGSGILNDPKEVHVATGASNAREGFDTVFESPFIAGILETYDTAAAMAAEYSASAADVSFELPNDFYTPSRFGQYPAGTRFTDGKRNYRIKSASQTHSKVSGNAVPHTTIGDYVASYPAGATIADEKARHAGRTIKQFNISPLRGNE